MAVGSLWYSNVLFAKPWMKLLGKTEKDMKSGNMGAMYGKVFVMALIQSFVLMMLVTKLNLVSVVDGAILGFWVWLGFVVTTSFSDYLFSGRPIKLFAINESYYLVVLVLVGGLFGAWH